MKHAFFCGLLFFTIQLHAQQKNIFSFAITDNASAYPFTIFAGFLKEPFHAGFELGWGRIIKEKVNHDWYWDLRLGYFYHRWVQHAIPFSFNFGYRYKFAKHFFADASIGAGYFHSIPATEVLRLGSDGNYENAKGIGRAQVMFGLNLGVGYQFYSKHERVNKVFMQYRQLIQAPFVKSYVPLLPYNQLAWGFSIEIPSHKK